MLVTASVHFKSDGSWPSGDFLNTPQYIDADRPYSFWNFYQKIIHCPTQTAYNLMKARSVSVHSIDSLVIYRVYQSTNSKFHCEKNKKNNPKKLLRTILIFLKPDKFKQTGLVFWNWLHRSFSLGTKDTWKLSRKLETCISKPLLSSKQPYMERQRYRWLNKHIILLLIG